MPEECRVIIIHDLGKFAAYGVYAIRAIFSFVNSSLVITTRDTAEN